MRATNVEILTLPREPGQRGWLRGVGTTGMNTVSVQMQSFIYAEVRTRAKTFSRDAFSTASRTVHTATHAPGRTQMYINIHARAGKCWRKRGIYVIYFVSAGEKSRKNSG